MNVISVARITSVLAAAAMCVACATNNSAANRGKFAEGSCKADSRVAVDANAAYALYLDKDGNLLTAAFAEDLKGTKHGMLCPTPVFDSADPAPCPTGYCPRLMSGKTYCLRC